MSLHSRFFATLLSVSLLAFSAAQTWAKKPKAPEAPEPAATDALPADLNAASMRVNALDTLYQLDLSPEQITLLKTTYHNTASTDYRAPAKANSELADLLKKMQAAILAGNDDANVSLLRGKIIQAANADNMELDDAVRPTPSACRASADFCQNLKSSQVAAYIALHADEVGDPLEIMNQTLSSLRGEKNSDFAADTTTAELEAGNQVAILVAGADGTKAKAVSDRVVAWLKSGETLTDADFDTHHTSLTEEARKIVGRTPPFDALKHWMEYQLAILLSNPETGHAVDLFQAIRKGSE